MDASKTGDVKNNLTKFLKLIRKMKLEADPHVEQLLQGSPLAYLPVLHQALVHYSLPLSRWLTEKGYKLHGRNDLRFVETMYRALRDAFSYKPDLTREQFLAKGFAERKMIMSTRILELCQAKHKELSRRNKHKKRQRQHADLNSRPSEPQYRHPQRVEPEIFNVCASEGVSSVWEEPVEYRVDTPFSAAKREQQALPVNLNGLTPPPAPRRGLAYLQYMGQITPTRRQIHMHTPQSCTDLDITPVATPLKPSVRVEREGEPERALIPMSHPGTRESFSSSSSSSDTESLMSAEQPPARAAGPVLLSASQPPSHSLHQQDLQGSNAHSTATRLSADQLLHTAHGAASTSDLHNSLEQRIQELTSCIEKMSAKMVLLETQVQLNEQKGGNTQDHASQPASNHASAPSIPVTSSAEADGVRATLSSVGLPCNGSVTGVEGGPSGTEDVTELASECAATQLTPHLPLVSKHPTDGLSSMHMDTALTNKDLSAGMITSDALITQLRRKTQETQMFLHSVMSSRPSLVR